MIKEMVNLEVKMDNTRPYSQMIRTVPAVQEAN